MGRIHRQAGVARRRGTVSEVGSSEPPLCRKRVAYLISQYPAVNHTFILREVLAVRKCGVDVRIVSIRDPDRSLTDLAADERSESEQAKYVIREGMWGASRAHLQAFITRPVGYLRGFRAMLRFGLRSPSNLRSCVLYFTEALIAGRWIMANRITHVHTHFASNVAWLIQATFPISMSMTIHGPSEFDDVDAFCLAEKVSAATFVVAISRYGQGQLYRASTMADWPKIHMARLGVDGSVFAPVSRPTEARPFRLLSVARLAAVKGQLVLLQSIAELVREGRDVRLEVIGDGPDRESLMAATAELNLLGHVSFAGWQNQPEVRRQLAVAHAFVLTSFAEGIPVVLMEAMATELPCVATWIMGIPELIRDEINGLLVPPADVAGVAGAIRRLMDDSALRLDLGRAGRTCVLRDFNLAHNSSRVARLLEAAVSGGDTSVDGVVAPAGQDEASRNVHAGV